MASEQFSLCWDNFHKNMSSGMNSLLESEDLVDVTLAVQGKCLKAHKMVLSVCSPYFKELFKSNPCQHPIVFMKDVSYEALSDLLQFMYQGEVQVSQENLTTFIKTAEALQIKGLTADGNGSADNETSETHEKPQQRHVEEYKPMPRPKKQPAPAVAPSPPVKRSRLSSDSQSTGSVAATPITKQEPSASASIGFSNVVQPEQVHFKMEPSDQSGGMLDETGDETFGDDGLDYSMMEGGVGESEGGEPQAGTSGADGTGEGQGTIYISCGRKYPKLVLDNNHYCLLSQAKDHTKWRCLFYYKTKCRASLSTYSNVVRVMYSHNHFTERMSEEKKQALIPKRVKIVRLCQDQG
ncbi:unnamed protein product [Callosobruchus maculatus]|uniref:BTB domain-containing protein n=1 Tax=Callosobruchus maculatus TaxID=64391 RepID=A0A653CPI0_CALMS|nr:unnamed protein product [Callosobruchus maculatus]